MENWIVFKWEYCRFFNGVCFVIIFQPSRHQWQIAFYIAAAIYLFGALFYLLLGSGEEQPWASKEYLATKQVPINFTVVVHKPAKPANPKFLVQFSYATYELGM